MARSRRPVGVVGSGALIRASTLSSPRTFGRRWDCLGPRMPSVGSASTISRLTRYAKNARSDAILREIELRAMPVFLQVGEVAADEGLVHGRVRLPHELQECDHVRGVRAQRMLAGLLHQAQMAYECVEVLFHCRKDSSMLMCGGQRPVWNT